MSAQIIDPARAAEADRRTQFIQERQYLKNVTPKTLDWYHQSFKVFEGCTTEAQYKSRIIQLRMAKKSPVSINTWLRVINAYLKWSGEPYRFPRLKEDDTQIEILTPEHMQALLRPLPRDISKNARRIQCLAALLLDTGLRIDEAVHLQWRDVDLDNLLVTVMGKGRKERRVPLSLEGRRWIYNLRRELVKSSPILSGPSGYVFTTRTGAALSIRNAQRDLASFCEKLGITGVRCSPHTFRHTFAVNYLRNGGNLEYLRRILGHSNILITQRYLRALTPDDLQSSHQKLSPLAVRG